MDKKPNAMSFLDHLEQLRWHLFRSCLAIMLMASVAFIGKDFIFDTINRINGRRRRRRNINRNSIRLASHKHCNIRQYPNRANNVCLGASSHRSTFDDICVRS